MGFAVSVNHRMKITENKKIVTYLELDREQKKKFDKKTGYQQQKNHHHPAYSIVETSQNIGTSPGNLVRLVVTQTPGKDPQTIDGVKISQGVK